MIEEMTPIDAWSAWRAVGVGEGRRAEGINWSTTEPSPGPTAVDTIVFYDCDGHFWVIRTCKCEVSRMMKEAEVF